MTADDPAAVVRRYLDALRDYAWDELAGCLDEDVERIGPYRDEYRGRDQYSAFLARTIESLPGYELRVDRVVAAGTTVFAELSETVDDGPRGEQGPAARVRTQEGIVFDVVDGRITRVAVYLQTSERIPASGPREE
jgi:ketosteroid isomerase-like protein